VAAAHPLDPGLSRLKQNIVANLSGRLIVAAVGLAVVPLIVRLMGIEAYGLVAFFTSIQAVFGLLDLGLSATINRELARLSVNRDASTEMRDLVRTLESAYWGIAILIGAGMLALAPAVPRWVRPEHLSPGQIEQAALVMGIVMALQWPLSFYEGGLMGLQRQVAWNAVSVSMSAVRQAGAVIVLWLVSPTVQTYLWWQAIAYGLQTGLTAWMVWRSMPAAASRPRFRTSVLAGVWRFAAGMTGTTIATLGLTQMDKLVVSRMLPLNEFGYYSLAAVAAGGLNYVIGPIFAAVFPRFSELIAAGSLQTLRDEYHRVAQFSSVIVLAAACVLIVFAPQILQLWTRDPVVVARAHRVLSVLAAGTALNALVHVPYALQLASGWTSLMMYANAIAVVVLVPATILLVREFGAVGAAAAWVALNAGYVLITVPVMHRRLLRGDLGRWYTTDVAAPLIGAVAVVLLGRLALPANLDPWMLGGYLVLVSGMALTCAALAAPAIRAALVRAVGHRDWMTAG